MSWDSLFERIVEKVDNTILWFFDRWRIVPILLILFLSGFVFGVIATYEDSPNTEVAGEQSNNILTAAQKVFEKAPQERNSPYDWIKESQIHVYNDRIVIDISDAEWATFTDTNSMDPVIDFGANAIEIVPKNESDIHLGDIISYKSEYTPGTIIHRVVEIGEDSAGWYTKTKGDNNNDVDPGKIRFSQVQRIVVAIIY